MWYVCNSFHHLHSWTDIIDGSKIIAIAAIVAMCVITSYYTITLITSGLSYDCDDESTLPSESISVVYSVIIYFLILDLREQLIRIYRDLQWNTVFTSRQRYIYLKPIFSTVWNEYTHTGFHDDVIK